MAAAQHYLQQIAYPTLSLPVIAQVISSSKHFAANIARKWSLVGMGPLVNLEIVRLAELSFTILADVTFFETVFRFFTVVGACSVAE